MANSRHAAARIMLWAMIGEERYEVTDFAAAFELNTIPLATITLAVGRNAATNVAAKIHRQISSFTIRMHVSVRLRIVPLGSSGDVPNDWKPATGVNGIRIFDGYAVGPGWSRGPKSASFTLSLQHWLSDLHYSSAVSGSSHPGNPADYTYAAAFLPSTKVAQAGGVPQPGGTWIPQTPMEINGISRADLELELWTEVIKPWMEFVAAQDTIDIRLATQGEDGSNKAALAALARMNQDGDFPANAGMSFGDVSGQAVANGVSKHLQRTVGGNAVNTTLWGKLINEWAPVFMFSVVPRVENALIVPFAGALSGPPFCHIRASEYDGVQLMGRMSQNLRAVGIVSSIQSKAGGTVGGEGGGLPGLAGLYPPDPTEPGLIMLKMAPNWLSDPVQEHLFSRDAAAINDLVQTADTPAGTGKPRKPGADPAKSQDELQEFTQRLAHQAYVLAKLSGRGGELAGRLRFDIAPGSQIGVEGGSELFTAKDGLGTPFFGTVQRVSLSISAQAQKAGTSFTLAWLRNTRENSDAKTVVDVPPLYNKRWVGGNLINGFKAPY